MCIFITGYGQNETLSCLIDYNLQTSKQSLSAAQILSPFRHNSGLVCCLWNSIDGLKYKISEEFSIGCDFHGIRDKTGPVTVERL